MCLSSSTGTGKSSSCILLDEFEVVQKYQLQNVLNIPNTFVKKCEYESGKL